MVLTRNQIAQLQRALPDLTSISESHRKSDNFENSSVSTSSSSSQENSYQREHFIVEYKNKLNNMASVSNISNPYAGESDLATKVGLSLYQKAVEVLPKDKNLGFDQDKSMEFSNEMDKANTRYVWGSIYFKIPDHDENNRDLLEDFSKLKLLDVIAHLNRFWHCITEDNVILVKDDSTFTKDMLNNDGWFH